MLTTIITTTSSQLIHPALLRSWRRPRINVAPSVTPLCPAENYTSLNDAITFFWKIAISVSLISNHNSFRVLFDKIASVYFV